MAGIVSTRFVPKNLAMTVRGMSTLSGTGIRWDRKGLEPELNAMLDNKGFMELLSEAQTRFAPVYNDIDQQRAALWEDIKQNGLRHREDTAGIRNSDYKVAEIPPILQKRPVELTGPAYDATMLIQGLNSGKLAEKLGIELDPKQPLYKYMPDAEDAGNPRLDVEVRSVYHLMEALAGRLTATKTAADGSVKSYEIGEHIAFPTMRMPGLHFEEASMVDAGYRPVRNHLLVSALYMYYVAPEMIARGWPPSVYQPKLQTYEDAMLVNDVFEFLERELGHEAGSTKMTILAETHPILAQLDEVIHALRSRLVGVNDGRWDKIASDYEFNPHGDYPDPAKVTMESNHMRAYTQLTSYLCEKRGTNSIGGMNADLLTAENVESVTKTVQHDKELERSRGKIGGWGAQPKMMEIIGPIFVDLSKVKIEPTREVSIEEVRTFPKSLQGPQYRTEEGLRTALSVTLQYIAAWIGGRGAVALKGKMEDMATAEMNYKTLWTWIHNKREITFSDRSVKTLTKARFDEIFAEVSAEVKADNEIPFAQEHLGAAERTLKTLVMSKKMHRYIADVAYDLLNHDVQKPAPFNRTFETVQFAPDAFRYMKPHENTDGAHLVKERGAYLHEYLQTRRDDNLPPHFKFLGCTIGLSASNVVYGGAGNVGAYLGGWQANGMRNRLMQSLPDTLNIFVDDAASAGKEFNNFLRRAEDIMHLEYEQAMDKIADLPAGERELAQAALDRKTVSLLDKPVLIDLEQGWRNIHATRLAVNCAIDNGVNVIHIEDQGKRKRCGHLGDKELAPWDEWAQVLESANLTAQLRLGKGQRQWNYLSIVARTDALSAKRIEYSKNLEDPSHVDHPFVDFERGMTPDGQYYYLKQGINPETGNPYGLDLSIARCTEVVKRGLASHVWMETPDADLHVAKAFMDGVNEKLAPFDKRAQGLYNHSPSFDWDVGFYPRAVKLATTVLEFVKQHIYPDIRREKEAGGTVSRERLWLAEQALNQYLKVAGDPVQSDYSFTNENISWLLRNALDACSGEQAWQKRIQVQSDLLDGLFPTLQTFKAQNELKRVSDLGYRPEHHMANIIVAQRLRNFGPSLAAMGFNLHLITLPEWHVLYRMHQLSEGYDQRSMEAFVEFVQRAERKYQQAHIDTGRPYPFYNHQRMTGTGVDAEYGKILGSADVNALSESTEADDLKKREQLKMADDPQREVFEPIG